MKSTSKKPAAAWQTSVSATLAGGQLRTAQDIILRPGVGVTLPCRSTNNHHLNRHGHIPIVGLEVHNF